MKKFSQLKKEKKYVLITESDESTVTKVDDTTNTTEVVEKTNVASFFSKLFESREMAHIYHLSVKGEEGSYASHKALNDYYEGILELIDTLIEVYQGQYDIVEGYDVIDTTDVKSKEKLEYFQELAEYIKAERSVISEEDTHLQNIIDEMVALLYQTIYKLRFMK